MPGVGTILLRRAIALTFALIVIVTLTAIIMEATGYAESIWKAIMNQELQAYYQSLRNRGFSPEKIKQLVEEKKQELIELYGLNKPWYERVGPLIINTLTFNLGISKEEAPAQVAGVQPPAPVAKLIMLTLPRTIVMLTIAEIICAAIALSIAPIIAYRHGTLLDRGVVTYAALFNAIPVWWLGMVFIQIFGYTLRIFPTSGRYVMPYIKYFWQDPLSNLVNIAYYAFLPIITVVIVLLGGWLYSVRAMVLRVVREDFVMVAKAKGLPEKLIARRYILRVMAPPVTTSVILALAGSLGGFIITESVFDWPGMGSLYYAAISSGDVPTILGLTYVLTLVYIIARFILEVLYIMLDPRVRLR